MTDAELHHAISTVIHRYSRAMDDRDWALMDDAFTADAVADFGGYAIEGRAAIVKFIRGAIECCARTQHQNSNIEIERDGDVVRARCKVAAWHTGKGATQGQIYLALATYEDEFIRTPAGWRMRKRAERTLIDVWLDGSKPGDLAAFFAAAFAPAS